VNTTALVQPPVEDANNGVVAKDNMKSGTPIPPRVHPGARPSRFRRRPTNLGAGDTYLYYEPETAVVVTGGRRFFLF
jgi:hypothetical protein